MHVTLPKFTFSIYNLIMTPKAIIFDKDGTLFPYTVWNTPIRSFLSKELFMERLKGEEKEKCIDDFARLLGFESDGSLNRKGLFFSRNFIKASFSFAFTSLRHSLDPISSAIGLSRIKRRYLYGYREALLALDLDPLRARLDELKRKGVILALFTNDVPESVAILLDVLGSDYFTFITDGTSHHKKPSVKGVEDFSLFYGIRPEDMVLVSDSPRDLKMGKKAGIKTLLAIEGTADEETLKHFTSLLFKEIISALDYIM